MDVRKKKSGMLVFAAVICILAVGAAAIWAAVRMTGTAPGKTGGSSEVTESATDSPESTADASVMTGDATGTEAFPDSRDSTAATEPGSAVQSSTAEKSANPGTTALPEQITAAPEDRSSSAASETRSPERTTGAPGTQSPASTKAQGTAAPLQTYPLPVTMPNGQKMVSGDRYDDVLIAPNGDEVKGYWKMGYEPEFIVEVPELEVGETYRWWCFIPKYNVLQYGTYIGLFPGRSGFHADETLPAWGTGAYTNEPPKTVASGSWW